MYVVQQERTMYTMYDVGYPYASKKECCLFRFNNLALCPEYFYKKVTGNLELKTK